MNKLRPNHNPLDSKLITCIVGLPVHKQAAFIYSFQNLLETLIKFPVQQGKAAFIREQGAGFFFGVEDPPKDEQLLADIAKLEPSTTNILFYFDNEEEYFRVSYSPEEVRVNLAKVSQVATKFDLEGYRSKTIMEDIKLPS